jgi:cytochrome c oxidase assembly factor CtaG
MTGEIVHMASMGLLTSVVAPGIVLATRGSARWRRVPAPPMLVLPLFLILHAAVTVLMGMRDLPDLADLCLHAVLLVGAVVFWLPVLVPAPGFPEAGRGVYLFLAAPSLDLAGVYLVIIGQEPGGLAMIVGMLPLCLAAVVVTWRWIAREERLAARQEMRS